MSVENGSSTIHKPLSANAELSSGEVDDLLYSRFGECYHIALECARLHAGNNKSIKSCFLEYCFESPSLSPDLLYPMTFILILIMLMGVVGNAIVCIVSRGNVFWLNSVTSAYLVNLSIADLASLIAGLPFDIHLMWHQYPWELSGFLCHFKGWLSETTTYVSVLTIVAFTFERYAAICQTFQIRATLNRRVSFILIGIWIIGGLCAVPYGLYHQLYTLLTADHWPLGFLYGPIEQTTMCMLPIAFDAKLRQKFLYIMHWSMITFFALPLVAILICYSLIGGAIRRSIRRSSTLNSIGKRHFQNNRQPHKKALIILASVVAAFFLCYAPYQTQRLLFFYITDISDPFYRKVNHYLYIISGISYYLGSTVNPLLYNAISARFRKAFRAMLCCNFKFKSATTVINSSKKPPNYASTVPSRRQSNCNNNNLNAINNINKTAPSPIGGAALRKRDSENNDAAAVDRMPEANPPPNRQLFSNACAARADVCNGVASVMAQAELFPYQHGFDVNMYSGSVAVL